MELKSKTTMFIDRKISNQIKEAAKKYPIILLTGARQTGKTTLVKHLFADYTYYNLEFPDIRLIAKSDPRNFLTSAQKMIIDEAQYVPELFSFIQALSDDENINGKYIITGSNNFYLLQNAGQSLAGRVAIFFLNPFTANELKRHKLLYHNEIQQIFYGFYPRIYNQKLKPNKWFANYVNTYLYKDIRNMQNIKDIHLFTEFLHLSAANTSQIVNYNKISNIIGVDNKTIKSWYSLLEASFLLFTVRPYYKNFGKRISKRPKIYYTDTGLVSYLINIRSYEQIQYHPLRGALFETLIMSEINKFLQAKNIFIPLYFWRDASGNEIDCIIENANNLLCIEIKSAKTFNTNLIKGLKHFPATNAHKIIIYAGDLALTVNGISIVPWTELEKILDDFFTV